MNLDQEKEELKKSSSFVILDYIKSSIEILIDLKIQEKLENLKYENQNNSQDQVSFYDDEGVNEYEKYLRKMEAENRNHIKVLKLIYSQ